MRLWHEALIPYLPRQQLLGQHRECCALRGRGWGKPHSVVNYVFDHPYGWLVAYHSLVMDEMEKRGYTPYYKWRYITYRGKNCGPYRDISCMWDTWDAVSKTGYIYPEHNAAYLQECLDNLAGKGIHIDMGVKK